MKHLSIILSCLLPSIALADTWPDLACVGTNPNWTLTLGADHAEFAFPAPVAMTIPQSATAAGQDWPKALTLVSRESTAILVLNKRQCNAGSFSVDILTQEGDTPLLLTGCCLVGQ